MTRNVLRLIKTLGPILVTVTGFFVFYPPEHPAFAQSVARQATLILEQKCGQCHGASAQMSGLDLRTRENILRGGASGPAIVPGDAAASLLYRRIAGMEKPVMPMAPMTPLTAAEIATIRTWITQGAAWDTFTNATTTTKPVDNAYREKQFTAADREWWAFRKPARPDIPPTGNTRGQSHPIDAFVHEQLQQRGLTPAPRAGRATLIRRAYLDLLGLLPPPAAVDSFVNDKSPHAWEQLIDRLLASPHYGERWGRFWLDVVRYADSSGYEHDFDNANAWRYRDYVIRSFNQDKPYNRFLVEQLAGDELDDGDQDSLIATTFYRIGPRVRFREKDNPYYRYEYLDDTIRTVFQGMMGLSVNCARCHDHKFDPVTRLDYYRAMAMLNGQVEYNHPLAAPDVVATHEARKKTVEDQIRPLMQRVIAIEAPYRRAAFEKRLAKFPEEIQTAVRTPEDKRTPGQKLLAAQIVSMDIDPDAAATQNVAALYSRNRIKVSDRDQATRNQLLDQVEALVKQLPAPLPVAEGVRDGDYRLTPDGAGDEPLPGKGDRFNYGVDCCFLPQPGKPYAPPPVYFAANGQDVTHDQTSFVVQPGFLQVLAHDHKPVFRPPQKHISSGRRRALAEWIVSPGNPLTARVIVNRVWSWHFGRGLVATPGNFGKMGAAPTHPALLDWLAMEFMGKDSERMKDEGGRMKGSQERQKAKDKGQKAKIDGAQSRPASSFILHPSSLSSPWSLKRLHRLIMTSATYQMASGFAAPANMEKDAANVWLWRFPLRRLEGETIRDVILSASGQLNLQAGGPPFFPAIPPAVRDSYQMGRWVMTKEEPATWRRGVYSYWKRGLKYPMFEVYDQPDPNVTCETRNVTTVPTQALTLLNNEFVLIQAERLAERIAREAGDEMGRQARLLYHIAYSRAPEVDELARARTFMQKQRAYHQSQASANVSLLALTDLAHVILNTNEFVYIN
ncbi:MAG: DUF1553 domain-containing protein [Blastocatellia bacterium]